MLNTGVSGAPFERELVLPDERRRLVRLCARLTANEDAAEDLAQETLLEAWRSRHKLRDPRGRFRWLAAIARHVCQRWARAQGRALAHLTRLDGDDPATPPPSDWLADETDLEVELERAELATLLDRALALLPPETRAVLVARCIEETPQAEVAARLGLSEGALGVRLHRGKLALRRVLATALREDAAAYGLSGPAADGWQETRIWCPLCGQHRVRGKFIASNLPVSPGQLMLRCPSCHTLPDEYMTHHVDYWAGTLVGVHGIKAAYSRVLRWADTYYRQGLVDRVVVCMKCGRQACLWMGLEGPAPPSWRHERGVHVTCRACNPTNNTTLEGIALALPEGRRFIQAHPRTRRVPEREVETTGRAAVVVSHASVTGAARLDVVFDRASFAVLRIHQSPGS